jgi:hypothetical protein
MSFRNTKTPTKPTTKPKYIVPMRKHARTGVMEYYLEGEVLEKFIKLFPIHSNRRIMQWFGLSHATVQRFKRKLGLKKDMAKIRKEQAADIKKICEKNGYYDSIRGKRPSEACMEAARAMRAAGFQPIRQLKASDPRKYKRLMKKKSEQRKELHRKEALREKYGLERHTKLRLQTMTHKMSSQKHSMIAENNYFADPEHVNWICYDSETKRSAVREATAERIGLVVVEGETSND